MFEPPPPPASWERKADGTAVNEVAEPGGPPAVKDDLDKIELTVWLAVGSDLTLIPLNEHGILYSEECYLFLYRHYTGREGCEKEAALIYFWIGDDSKAVSSLFLDAFILFTFANIFLPD